MQLALGEISPTKRAAIAFALCIGTVSAVDAVTLTIAPDNEVYIVGEQITLTVFGDPTGESTSSIYGSIQFDPNLAEHFSSTQIPLTSFGGLIPWTLSPVSGGEGFAEAFSQIAGLGPLVGDCCLTATVVLTAMAPGVLSFDWDTTGVDALRFFQFPTAPGASVTIVPEPSTLLLLAAGLLAMAARRRRRAFESRIEAA